jgi:hypothetical protein
VGAPGCPLGFILTGADIADIDQARPLVRAHLRPGCAVIMDKDYDSDALRAYVKGIQRDTGGYAVALAASLKHIYDGRPGETYFSTADVGWVVGHSYTVYGPLIQGMRTVIYESLPTSPDGAIWWKIASETCASVMFPLPRRSGF